MPTFYYEALDKSGKKTQKGTVEAASSEEAIQRLKLQQLYPTEIREEKGKKSAAGAPAAAKKKKKKKPGTGFSIGKVSQKHLTVFTRQLSTLQDAGLPLLRSLQILEQQQKPGKLKSILLGVVEEVEGGASLSEGMSKFPKAFDTLYCKMVNAGEIGGVLDVILQRLSEFMEKAQRLKQKVVGAMIYPVAVIIVALAIVSGIMYFIIPKFQEIFEDFGVELPALTQGLIDVSAWISGDKGRMAVPGVVYVAAAPFAIFFFLKFIRKTKYGKAFTDTTLMYIPVIGGLVRKTVIARFTRTLGTLVAAGVPILEAVTITKETSGNYVFEKALGKVHDSIREGESFAAPLRESKTCDAIVVNMIDVGEETGDMDSMLLKIADNYDEEVDVAVAGLVKLIEPMLVVGLGGLIGTIVVSMFMPMVKMIESLQK
ncbi:MAG: type II secretion system F family protein [Phycisphaerae bacterium]|nr:type II secretion system F family protein [Phycisphaerae bacterium]